TRSRASLALLGLGTGAVLGFMFLRGLVLGRIQVVRRVAILVVCGGLAVTPLAIKIADGVIKRFKEAPASSKESRDRANEAAKQMLRDAPLTGKGLNHYVHYLDYGYGLDIEEGDRTIVHHVYWLTGAELGWPGLLLLVAIVLTWLLVGVQALLTAQDDWVAHVALGLTVGYGLCHLQHLYEWAMRKPQVLFQLTTMAGAMARLSALRRVPAPGSFLPAPAPAPALAAPPEIQ
ncbi:MAG TPA: hypothetical protein DEA08_38785, partial [Planctomycetes bacterium]|nr:hypothetical protein [Planctomycetota bacterium]